MIYTVGGQKGGSGKTTTAVTLAVRLFQEGRDVLLVDADDQESATDFTDWRIESLSGNPGYTAIKLTGTNLKEQVIRQRNKYDDIVIDTGGRDTTSQRAALLATDIYLVPFAPSSVDIWTVEKVRKLINEASMFNDALKAFTFLNKAHTSGSENEESAEALKECEEATYIPAPLIQRKIYQIVMAEGLTIFDSNRKDPKAINEFETLFGYLFKSK